MRRRAPRSLGSVLPGVLSGAQPATLLARVQALWPGVAGEALGSATAPVAEREGVVTIVCESSLWAHELDLLQRDLLARLSDALEASGGGAVERLRFSVGSRPNDH
jgi:predicted nucleic acid-binding Zn ribbon protein